MNMMQLCHRRARSGDRVDFCHPRQRRAADHAIDRVRERFGWDAIGYGSVALGMSSSVSDEFRKLAEKDL
jgi:hypothetical protein